jgi:hypothetical protein
LILEHHGDVIPNGIGQPARLANKFLGRFAIFEIALA